jgi:hypothetical protein
MTVSAEMFRLAEVGRLRDDLERAQAKFKHGKRYSKDLV